MRAHNLIKVMFELPADAWHGHASEGLWAEPVGSDRFKLRNSPFYVRGVSLGDIVFAREEAGRHIFTGISLHGGHSTYRVMLQLSAASAEFAAAWRPLQDLGCSYEGVESTLLAIDVPPATDIFRTYAFLEAGQDAGVWDFEEGHCGHPLPESGD